MGCSSGPCCNPRGIQNACPEDNFSLVCTLEVDGCSDTTSMTGELEEYRHITKKALDSELDLDSVLASFEGGLIDAIFLHVTKPVNVRIGTEANSTVPDVESIAPAEAFTGTGPYALAHGNVVPSTVNIAYTDGALVAVTMTDNGAGVLTGSNGDTGTIDYVTGAFSIVFGAGLSGAVQVDYHYLASGKEFTMYITSILEVDGSFKTLGIIPVTDADVDLWLIKFV